MYTQNICIQERKHLFEKEHNKIQNLFSNIKFIIILCKSKASFCLYTFGFDMKSPGMIFALLANPSIHIVEILCSSALATLYCLLYIG